MRGTGDDGAVVPAFGVDRVDAEELQMAGFESCRLNEADHAAVFKVEETAAGGGKGECRGSGVAEDEQFHLPPEGR